MAQYVLGGAPSDPQQQHETIVRVTGSKSKWNVLCVRNDINLLELIRTHESGQMTRRKERENGKLPAIPI